MLRARQRSATDPSNHTWGFGGPGNADSGPIKIHASNAFSIFIAEQLTRGVNASLPLQHLPVTPRPLVYPRSAWKCPWL